jgi:hypothetical protein
LARIEENNPAMYRPSSLLPYELRPGYRGQLRRREFRNRIAIGSGGFRGPDFPARKGGRPRILAVGDSFTFGWGVEEDEAWPRRLERVLAEEHGVAAEVINAGFAAGYYPDTYYLWLVERGLALDPDLVVLGLYIGNDLDHPLVEENLWLEVDGRGLPRRIVNRDSEVDHGYWVRRVRPRRYRLPWLRDRHLFQLALGALRPLLPRRAGAAAASTGPPPMYRLAHDARTVAVIARVERLLGATAEAAERRGAPLAVLLIPERIQIGPFPPGEELRARWDEPQRLLGGFFAAAGIPCLDLLAAVRAAPAGSTLYYPQDSHFNRDGHEVAARALGRFLLERRLVRR